MRRNSRRGHIFHMEESGAVWELKRVNKKKMKSNGKKRERTFHIEERSVMWEAKRANRRVIGRKRERGHFFT